MSDSFREGDNGIPQAANKFLHACQKCIMYENNKTELAHTNVKFAGTKRPLFFFAREMPASSNTKVLRINILTVPQRSPATPFKKGAECAWY